MPLSCCSLARFIASLISFTSVLRCATILRSTTETFGVGTRIATPSSLPCSSGSTRPIALAAPVEVEFLPRKLGRIALGGNLDLAVAEAERVAVDGHGAGEAAMHGIKAQQVG